MLAHFFFDTDGSLTIARDKFTRSCCTSRHKWMASCLWIGTEIVLQLWTRYPLEDGEHYRTSTLEPKSTVVHPKKTLSFPTNFLDTSALTSRLHIMNRTNFSTCLYILTSKYARFSLTALPCKTKRIVNALWHVFTTYFTCGICPVGFRQNMRFSGYAGNLELQSAIREGRERKFLSAESLKSHQLCRLSIDQ